MKIGIDIGGSHIGIGAVDDKGKIIEKHETDLINCNLEEYIEKFIQETIEKLIAKYDIEQIGVASPGTPKDGKLTSLVNLGIQEINITKIIRTKFSGEIQIRNDAKCAGLAEKTYGSLSQYQDAVFLCLGTGIGGCAFLAGHELVPKRNPGFEIGHMIIKKDGKTCCCGKKGCFETYCSIKRLKLELIHALNLEETISGENLVSIIEKESNELHSSNKEKIDNILNEYIENLIVGLSNIIDILEPEAICLGGSFVHFEKILFEKLVKEYYERKYVFNKQSLPELKLAKLGNDAGIIGATVATA